MLRRLLNLWRYRHTPQAELQRRCACDLAHASGSLLYCARDNTINDLEKHIEYLERKLDAHGIPYDSLNDLPF